MPVAAFVVALIQGAHSPDANEPATALQRGSRPPGHSYLQHTPPLRLLNHLADIDPGCNGKVGERIPLRAGPQQVYRGTGYQPAAIVVPTLASVFAMQVTSVRVETRTIVLCAGVPPGHSHDEAHGLVLSPARI